MEITQIAQDFGVGQGLSLGGSGTQNPFLDLVVTELQNQNPLEPVSNTDFLAQLAQFSTLEQLEALNSNLTQQAAFEKFGQASALVGKEVGYVDATGATQRGVVDSVLIEGQQVFAEIDGAAIPIDSVFRVFASSGGATDGEGDGSGAGPGSGGDGSVPFAPDDEQSTTERGSRSADRS